MAEQSNEQMANSKQMEAPNDREELCKNLVAVLKEKSKDFDPALLHSNPSLLDCLKSLGLLKVANANVEKHRIFDAIAKKQIGMATALLNRRRYNGRKDMNDSLLSFCVLENRLDLVKIVYYAEPSQLQACGPDKLKPIHLAARFADVEMCQWLTSKGARPTDPTYVLQQDSEECYCYVYAYVTVLHQAALNLAYGTENIRFFTSNWKLDLNTETRITRLTALHCALLAGNIDSAELLLSLGAKFAFKSYNLLHCCIRHEQLSSAKFCFARYKEFLENGRNLYIAVEGSSLEMCKWLIEDCNADPRDCREFKHRSILHLACCNMLHGAAIVEYLILEHGLDKETACQNLGTPLHFAIARGNIAAAEKLVFLDAEVGPLGQTENVLHMCMKKNFGSLFKIIYKKHPNLIAALGDGGENMLHYAAQYADLEMCQWLVQDVWFDVQSRSTDTNCNVLHYAAQNLLHGLEIAKYFLYSFNVDVTAKNKLGHTPLKYAKKRENKPVVKEFKLAIKEIDSVASTRYVRFE